MKAKAFLVATIVLASVSSAHARHHHHHRNHRHHAVARYADGRPGAWCGWWMRQYLGVANTAGNLARWWAGYGRNAGGPASGVIVVWSHHVGIITGHDGKNWIVKSGNDGHAVRERPRSVAGAIAFRWPS
jgi:hypothetical protein